MSERLPLLRAREIIAALTKDGWYEINGKGGHRALKHSTKPGRVTVPMHGARDIESWLLRSIIAQAGLTVEELRRLL